MHSGEGACQISHWQAHRGQCCWWVWESHGCVLWRVLHELHYAFLGQVRKVQQRQTGIECEKKNNRRCIRSRAYDVEEDENNGRDEFVVQEPQNHAFRNALGHGGVEHERQREQRDVEHKPHQVVVLEGPQMRVKREHEAHAQQQNLHDGVYNLHHVLWGNRRAQKRCFIYLWTGPCFDAHTCNLCIMLELDFYYNNCAKLPMQTVCFVFTPRCEHILHTKV